MALSGLFGPRLEKTGHQSGNAQTPGGGGVSFFSSYVGSGPASTAHLKNIRDFKHPNKIFKSLANPKTIPILYLDLKKTLKCLEMTSRYSPVL